MSSPPPRPSAKELLSRSRAFERSIRRGRPTSNNWCESLVRKGRCSEEEVASMAAETRPLVHEDALPAMEGFLRFKRQAGTEAERQLYAGMDLPGLVDRLLGSRPLSFVGACDSYTDKDGRHGAGDWERVAGDGKRIREYMTYDEIKLAALLQGSSTVAPINT